MVPIPVWLTNYFTIHVIMEMVNRASDKVNKIYPPQMVTPTLLQDAQKDLKLRREAFQVLKVYLDSDFIEDQDKKRDQVYEEWSSKVRLAEGLYNLILQDIQKVMTSSYYQSDAILTPRMITHLWTVYLRDEIEQNGAYTVEYPDDSPDNHPIFMSLKIRLEKQEKYEQYAADFKKISDFTKSLLEKSRTEGSTATLSYLETTYKVKL